MSANVDVIVLGAGAAGLMCAFLAGRRGFVCTLVEPNPVAGRKLRLAGGGRGNITNRDIHSRWYVSEQPSFAEKILRRCPPGFVLELLKGFGIGWEEREYGQIFCTVQAVRLVEALVRANLENGARLMLGCQPETISHDGGMFSVQVRGRSLQAPRLVIATGSPAWPAAGATDSGMRLARQWGHKIIPVRPVLVPFVLPASWSLHGLAGVSLPVRVSTGGRSFVLPLLFTHKGLSGPAMLQASCFWRQGTPLEIDFWPDHSLLELMHAPENGRHTVLGLLKTVLPSRLAERLVPPELAPCRVAQVDRAQRRQLATVVQAHTVFPLRNEGMRKAEAAAGGVDTAGVNSRTLESRNRAGLYFIGEVLDVTGLLGGYNLHWAWASAKAAAESFKEKVL